MSTTYAEDHPDRKAPTSVDAAAIEGLDREPGAKKKPTTKVIESDRAETKVVTRKTARTK